jgi:hypothetical protein
LGWHLGAPFGATGFNISAYPLHVLLIARSFEDFFLASDLFPSTRSPKTTTKTETTATVCCCLLQASSAVKSRHGFRHKKFPENLALCAAVFMQQVPSLVKTHDSTTLLFVF